jgi:7-cyano-7-deazaguanine reductase
MSELSVTKHLDALGKQKAAGESYDPSLLERFPNPLTKLGVTGSIELHHDYTEFTSLCPVTGAPDFAKIHVSYVPDEWCVESKSYKLFIQSFRNERDFHEACCGRIAAALIDLLDPISVWVHGEFTPRGGISVQPKISWKRANPQVRQTF